MHAKAYRRVAERLGLQDQLPCRAQPVRLALAGRARAVADAAAAGAAPCRVRERLPDVLAHARRQTRATPAAKHTPGVTAPHLAHTCNVERCMPQGSGLSVCRTLQSVHRRMQARRNLRGGNKCCDGSLARYNDCTIGHAPCRPMGDPWSTGTRIVSSHRSSSACAGRRSHVMSTEACCAHTLKCVFAEGPQPASGSNADADAR